MRRARHEQYTNPKTIVPEQINNTTHKPSGPSNPFVTIIPARVWLCFEYFRRREPKARFERWQEYVGRRVSEPSVPVIPFSPEECITNILGHQRTKTVVEKSLVKISPVRRIFWCLLLYRIYLTASDCFQSKRTLTMRGVYGSGLPPITHGTVYLTP